MKILALTVTVACAGMTGLDAAPRAIGRDGTTPVTTAKCVDVIDGDTLVLRLDGNEMTVELDGIDAPELGQPLGRQVRGFVRDLVHGREVTVEMVATDGGEATARVGVGGQDVSELLAERGLAWATADGVLAACADRARSAGCGIWLDPEPIPPWEFRKEPA